MHTAPVTFTFDLEDHRPHADLPKRYNIITPQILDFLAENKIRATVFIVGTLAEEDPGLVRRVAEAGHEIASHSWDHTVITKQTPEQFRDHTARSKKILEDVTGKAVSGYRAPVFSITRDCLWAVDILHQLGFEYSSSVLPAGNPLYGLPGAPGIPFRWPNGLLEIPAPVAKFGPLTTPYLGGFYFRYLPYFLIKNKITAAKNECLWTYWHPYDFDDGEKNFRIKDAPLWVSLLLWFNRSGTFRKLERLIDDVDIAKPFREQIQDGAFKSAIQQPDIKQALAG